MTARSPRRARPRKPSPTAILVEDMRSQFKVVIEAVQGLGETLESEMGAVRGELGGIRGDLANIHAAIGDHSRELREVAALVARKAEGAALAALEQRVTAIERRGGN